MEAQAIVNLRDGADGGARAEAIDGVDFRVLHFDVAALAPGVDGVEGEGCLAGPAQTGDHCEGYAGSRPRGYWLVDFLLLCVSTTAATAPPPATPAAIPTIAPVERPVAAPAAAPAA